jgi:hypothetical protein
MTTTERMLNEESIAWEPMKEYGSKPGYFRKCLADGLDGGIQAHIVRMPEGSEITPHFHDVSQYQVILEGTARFPEHTVDALGLHYTDAFRPYGPIFPGKGFTMAVIRRKKGGISRSPYKPENRKLVNPKARVLYGQSNQFEWEDLGGLRRKVLLRNGPAAPRAELLEISPGSSFQAVAAPHGEYHVLVAGSAIDGKSEIHPYTMRYILGSDAPRAIKAGPKGATWLVLGFDHPLP